MGGLPVEPGSDKGPGSGFDDSQTAGVIPSGTRGLWTLHPDSISGVGYGTGVPLPPISSAC